MTRVLVLGAGVSGRAAARLGLELGMAVTVFDENPAAASIGMNTGVATGAWDRELLNGIDLVVTSPGFSERSIPVVEILESGLPIWSEIEFASRNTETPIVAITGTNGKTSVTEATSAMLEASGLDAPATGNIGSPLSDFVGSGHDALVVEVSSFQLRFVETFHPAASALTNVAVDHLDWHGSTHSYRDAKAKVFANQTAEDLLVYDADDPGATSLAALADTRKIPVSGRRVPEGGAGLDGNTLVIGDCAVDVADLTSTDPAHLANLACAGSLAFEMGATADGVALAATRYEPGAHRRRLVATVNDVSWVDDSKATNPHAALASIKSFPAVVLIAGGLAKATDVTVLADESNVDLLIGIGEAGPALVEAAGDRGRLAGTLELAVEMAAQAADPGQTVLLAPGCASFDQFRSYGERGDRFAELVNELSEGHA